MTSAAEVICGRAAASSACALNAFTGCLVVGRELLSCALPGRDEPASRCEDWIPVEVRANGTRRPVGDLGVGSRVAQVAHGAKVQHGRLPLAPHPPRQLARDVEHRFRVASVDLLVAKRGPRPEHRFDPAGGTRDADPEAIVLTEEQERERETLERTVASGVEGRLCARVVHGGVAERAEDDRVARPWARHPEASSSIDRKRDSHTPRKVRGDRRGHRNDRELVAAEDLVPSTGDRLCGRGDDPEHDVPDTVDTGLRSAREIERTRPVVQKRRVIDSKRERDSSVRLVAGRADRVEGAAVLSQPARGVVRLPAVHLCLPDRVRLGWHRDRR